MSKRKIRLSSEDMAITSKSRNKVITCSTPEQRQEDSPSRDSDSLCDSEAASPVPFLCTQDGADGETDVVWNYYTPKANHKSVSHVKNSTPLSRKSKRVVQPKVLDKPLPRRKFVRSSQPRSQLFQDLIELNQNIHLFLEKKPDTKEESLVDTPVEGEEDIFNNSSDFSPKSGLRTNSRCLRKNLLSSKFSKPDPDVGLESDDSMNEHLIAASQMVEESVNRPVKTVSMLKMDQRSMDAILNTIKKCDSPKICNDSFDQVLGNLNDSVFDRLTQMPMKRDTPNRSNAKNCEWTVKEQQMATSKYFGRHCSMPESPSFTESVMPSTSGMVFGRHNSLPDSDRSSSQCTPDEIKRKHQQAREKLLARRLLPFTNAQESQKPRDPEVVPKKTVFQPRIASIPMTRANSMPVHSKSDTKLNKGDVKLDMKQLIEKKRQEALQRLRRRQIHSKMP